MQLREPETAQLKVIHHDIPRMESDCRYVGVSFLQQ